MRTDQPKVPGTPAGLNGPGAGPEHPKTGLESKKSGPENPKPSPENPKPGSAADLRGRSYRLARGHPSSPVEADGTHKPPAPRLKDIALPEPLTDAEHAEHVKEVRDRLDKARVRGLATDGQHTIDADPEAWDKERRLAHGAIIETLYSKASDVPCESRAIIAGGLSGAGKSTVLERYAGIDRSQYMTINPDQIKEQLAERGLIPLVEGLTPMEASDLVHEESSHIAKQLAMRAQAEGKNVIWDVTMCSRSTTERRITELRAAGYNSITGIFVDITVETAVTRSDARYREGHDDYRAGKGWGGRFIPEEVIRAQTDQEWGSANRKTFEAVKERFDSWGRYDNSAAAPVIKDSGHRREEAS